MFIANLKYKKSLEEVNKVLESHLEYLDKYYKKGKFICSGRRFFPEMGGIILFNSDNLEEAKKIMYEDPFYTEEIADYEIIEFEAKIYDEKFSDFVISK